MILAFLLTIKSRSNQSKFSLKYRIDFRQLEKLNLTHQLEIETKWTIVLHKNHPVSESVWVLKTCLRVPPTVSYKPKISEQLHLVDISICGSNFHQKSLRFYFIYLSHRQQHGIRRWKNRWKFALHACYCRFHSIFVMGIFKCFSTQSLPQRLNIS